MIKTKFSWEMRMFLYWPPDGALFTGQQNSGSLCQDPWDRCNEGANPEVWWSVTPCISWASITWGGGLQADSLFVWVHYSRLHDQITSEGVVLWCIWCDFMDLSVYYVLHFCRVFLSSMALFLDALILICYSFLYI